MIQTLNLTIEPGNNTFSNINLTLDSKSYRKIALIGKNGLGKSTFLKTLLGEIEPIEGQIIVQGEKLSYMPQDIKFPSQYELVGEYLESLLEESYEEYKIEIALEKVGLEIDFIYKNLQTLSGGEKMKTYLVKMLLEEPTILVLDEPTNNLDIAGLEWLEAFLKNFKGAVILVSHDRYFLNQVINTIWEINEDEATILSFSGNYENFLQERQKRHDSLMKQYEREERKIKELEIWVRANEFHPKYRFSSIVMSRKKSLKKTSDSHVSKPSTQKEIKIQDLSNEKKGRIVKVIVNKKTFGDNVLFENIELVLRKDEKLLIHGKNGTGKSTLLKILTGEDTDFTGEVTWSDDVKVGYLKQFSSLDENLTVLEAFQKGIEGICQNPQGVLFRFLFDANKVKQKVSTLSFGEKKRLDLAIILTNKPNVLILDEPTNHLDIFTRETIESFLCEQNIPMIVVSHDRYFIEKLGIENLWSMYARRKR